MEIVGLGHQLSSDPRGYKKAKVVEGRICSVLISVPGWLEG
jgi:hypothetical protein